MVSRVPEGMIFDVFFDNAPINCPKIVVSRVPDNVPINCPKTVGVEGARKHGFRGCPIMVPDNVPDNCPKTFGLELRLKLLGALLGALWGALHECFVWGVGPGVPGQASRGWRGGDEGGRNSSSIIGRTCIGSSIGII